MATPRPCIDALPTEIVCHVLTGADQEGIPFLATKWIWAALAVCRRWRAIIDSRCPRKPKDTSIICFSNNDEYRHNRRLRAVRASAASWLVRTSGPNEAVVAIKGVGICPPDEDLIATMVVANTVAALGWTQQHASPGTDWGRLLLVAARTDADISAMWLATICDQQARIDGLLRAAFCDNIKVLEMMLVEFQHSPGTIAERVWECAARPAALNTIALLFNMERMLDEGTRDGNSTQHNAWRRARHKSEWLNYAAERGKVGALDLCAKDDVGREPAGLFRRAIANGRTEFCEALLRRHEELLGTSVEDGHGDLVPRRFESPRSIPWLIDQPWFVPTEYEAATMTKFVAQDLMWSGPPRVSGPVAVRVIIALARRWPGTVWSAVTEGFDDVLDDCARCMDWRAAHAFARAFNTAADAGLVDPACRVRVDLWDHARRALHRNLTLARNTSMFEWRSIPYVKAYTRSLDWLGVLGDVCAGRLALSASDMPWTTPWQRQVFWDGVCAPTALPHDLLDDTLSMRQATTALLRAPIQKLDRLGLIKDCG
jgi:hypothetical protein